MSVQPKTPSSIDLTGAIPGNPDSRMTGSLMDASAGALFDILPDAAFLVEPGSSRIIEANAEALRIFGFQIDELLNLRAKDLIASDIEMYQQVADRLNNTDLKEIVSFEWQTRRSNGELLWIDGTARRVAWRNQPCVLVLLHDITTRRQTEERLRIVYEALDDCGSAVLITTPESEAIYLNAAFGLLFGYTANRLDEVVPASLFVDPAKGKEIVDAAARGGQWQGEIEMISRTSQKFPAYLRATPVLGEDYDVACLVFILNDISERKQLETQVFQSQNMKAIGQLAAGIAHEINTPTQYIGDNLRFLRDSFVSVLNYIDQSIALLDTHRVKAPAALPWEELDRLKADADMDYLRDEVPLAFTQSIEGIGRISEIVKAMRQFTHAGSGERKAMDLNQAIQNTITVGRNEWRYVAEVETHFDPDLPLVPCFPGEINQVLLNLIVNAAHAITDVVKPEGGPKSESETKGRITITTSHEPGWVEIRIADTGTGIPEDIRSRVFDMFFTTKDVGKGTGQGLSICHAVVVEKHHGTITFESEVGHGTTFVVRLPLGPLEDGKRGGAA